MAAKKPEFLAAGDGYVDVTLARPLEISGAKVAVLRMREPTVADQLAMDRIDGGEAAREIAYIANLTQQAPADIQRLTLRDYRRVQQAFALFID